MADGRLVAVFQPHRYSRTNALFDQFVRCFSDADLVLVSDIYPGGEEAIDGINSASLAKQLVCKEAHYTGSLDNTLETLRGLARRGDVVVTLGAGSVGTLAHEYLAGGVDKVVNA